MAKGFCLSFVMLSVAVWGQPNNNSIFKRLTLELDDMPLRANTRQATVEWTCINKKLTEKCLKYHNDLWFDFTVAKAGRYFLNVGAQRCQQQRGVQVVILEGRACETDSYRLLQCISTGLTDDVFVEMPDLQPGRQYLVNIDGFLGDQCEFEIQMATKPMGRPLNLLKADTFTSRLNASGKVVKIHWFVPDSLIERYQEFRVYRKKQTDRATQRVGDQPVLANAQGRFVQDYTWQDTLPGEGIFRYEVFGVQRVTEIPILVSENTIQYLNAPVATARPAAQQTLPLPGTANLSEPARVLVYDAQTMEEKFKTRLRPYSPALELELSQLGDLPKRLLVVIASEYSPHSREMYFRLNADGQWVRE
jgi:hypothetical protein